MKIFSSAQVKEWDAYTINHEPISSINLMERAATACCNWLIGKNFGGFHFRIFCGKGNNGGDGLAIARMLIKHHCTVTVYILEFGNVGSPDFQTNLARLHECSTDIHFIQSAEFFPEIKNPDIIIDALFGTGLNKPLEGISKELAEHINRSSGTIVSIDLPSGLFADKSSKGNPVIRASITLSFQNHKLAFLLPENDDHCGEVHLLHIGLHKGFENDEWATYELVDNELIKQIYKPRKKSAHKGTYGHAALLSGSYGMMGAAVLSAKACLRSGAGKLTSFIPGCGYEILQTAVPEAMCLAEDEKYLLSAPDLKPFDAVGIGPGIGIHSASKDFLATVFQKTNKPMVIDADALNTIAAHKALLRSVPAASILTPHPKEFERLFGNVENDFERLELASKNSKDLNLFIVLKGHYSFISTPQGEGYFNSTGNPGMATAGSGDVLTGVLTGLLAQGYTPHHAALLGTYLHGLAGDIAAEKYSQEAMLSGDITDCLGTAFDRIKA